MSDASVMPPFVETVAMSLEAKLRGLLAPDLLYAMCIELAEDIAADLRAWCPEKHEAWAHSTVKACPNCGAGVVLKVHLPELACCFATATSPTSAEVDR